MGNSTPSDPDDNTPVSIEQFFDTIRRIVRKCGLVAEPKSGSIHTIQFNPSFPMWMRFEIQPDGSATLVGIVRTYNFPGERSDYHILISIIWAAVLRMSCLASVRLIDIPHPAIPNEIHSRLVLFAQPTASYTPSQVPDFKIFVAFFAAFSASCQLFYGLYDDCAGDPNKEQWIGDDTSGWASRVSKALRYHLNSGVLHSSGRDFPKWSYYHRLDKGIVAFSFSGKLLNDLQTLGAWDASADTKVVEGQDSYLMLSGDLRNAVPKKTFRTMISIGRAFDLSISELSGLNCGTSAMIIPIESHLILVTRSGLASIQSECGYRTFNEARAKLHERHKAEVSVLFNDVSFEWRQPIADDRFEDLIFDLLNRESGVDWARKVGATRAADSGRDILAAWALGPAPWQKKVDEERVIVRRRVIVQCKTSCTSINLSKLPDVPQVLDLHDATGFLFVAFPRITPQVVDYMTRVPTRRGFWADWWTQNEIEDRLRKNPDVVRRYSDIVSISLRK
jgi:hypothetical protein